MSAHHGYEPRHHAAAERGGLMAERVDLDAVEDLHQSTTPGPWWSSPVQAAPGHYTIRGGPSDWRGFDGSLGGDTRPIARIAPAPAEDGTFVTEHDADAKFIVEAHRLLPALVAELRPAREVIKFLWQIPRDNSEFGRALAAYDQAVGQPATADQPPGEAP